MLLVAHGGGDGIAEHLKVVLHALVKLVAEEDGGERLAGVAPGKRAGGAGVAERAR